MRYRSFIETELGFAVLLFDLGDLGLAFLDFVAFGYAFEAGIFTTGYKGDDRSYHTNDDGDNRGGAIGNEEVEDICFIDR